MATTTTFETTAAFESFGDFQDIKDTLDFCKYIISILDEIVDSSIFKKRLESTDWLEGFDDFYTLYNGSKNIFIASIDHYNRLLDNYQKPSETKQLIDILYNLYIAGLTGEIGVIKRNRIQFIKDKIGNIFNVPLKALARLLKAINDFLKSLFKALNASEAMDEAKKIIEEVLNITESNKEIIEFHKEDNGKNDHRKRPGHGSHNLSDEKE